MRLSIDVDDRILMAASDEKLSELSTMIGKAFKGLAAESAAINRSLQATSNTTIDIPFTLTMKGDSVDRPASVQG